MRAQVYLAVSPQDEAVPTAFPKAHMAYGCGKTQLCLQIGSLPLSAHGGLLVLPDRAVPVQGDARLLAQQVVRECSRRTYHGVVADFESPPDAVRAEILQALAAALQRAGLPLVVPESYAAVVPDHVQILVSSAISGGSVNERLEAVARAWPGRVWLELRRLMMDFSLPCPSGEGKPLRQEEVEALRQAHPGLSFFSSELGCHYFTYQEAEHAHFVLFDTVRSLQYKLDLARGLGIRHGILLYPEAADLLPELEQALLQEGLTP